jgi:hypothetical protein
MTVSSPATARHSWNFFRTGGIDQVALTTGADLLALGQLDQKLWVVLSCPVKGLEIDHKTLELIDTDGDGYIHVRELVAAVNWAAVHLKQPADLLNPGDALPLSAINDLTPEGKTILSSARYILSSVGAPNAEIISVEDTIDTAKILTAKAPNGDGVITLRATTDAAAQQLIKDIIATTGGVPDRAGGQGVNAEKVDAFFAEVKSYLEWIDATVGKQVPELGEGTGAACVALRAVRPKVDDFFARCRLAAFDPRAIGALNRQEAEYLAIAAQDFSITAAEVAGFPLARIESNASLPLLAGVNPAWAAQLGALHQTVVAPLFGSQKTSLTAEEWTAITKKFAPFEAWLGSRVPTAVEKLGAARARELVIGSAKTKLADLIAQDKALAPEYEAISAVGRLARYYRDLRTLLHNFVNFADFYSPERLGVFQAGTLYMDSRACELSVQVNDVAFHSTFAAKSMLYVAYLDCKRAGGETMKVAACFTQGDSDFLFVGRNGLFYDRKGRDWDATVTKVLDAPISIRQAFWTPYKKVASFVEDQFAKFAAAKDKAATSDLAGGMAALPAAHPAPAGAAAPVAKPPAQPFDIAKFAGIFAAIGLAVGAIGGAVASVATGFMRLEPWQMPLAVAGALLIISGPSMLLAALKLRQRNLGPLLEPNGWAINSRVKINIPFGTKLTQRATLPPGSHLSRQDPYEDKAAKWRRRKTIAVLVILGLAALAWSLRHEGYYTRMRELIGLPTTPVTNTVPPER